MPAPPKLGHSNRDLSYAASSAPSTSTYGVDPPRPAKEGHEWVWFPGGYWAERERVDLPSAFSNKAFKWRNKSTRDTSSSQTDTNSGSHSHRSQHASPMSQLEGWSSKAPMPSPYLTEADHVLSLQRPTPIHKGTSNESSKSSPLLPGKVPWKSTSPLFGSPLTNATSTPLLDDSAETTRPMTPIPFVTDSANESPSKSPSHVKPKRSFMGLLTKSKSKSKANVAVGGDDYTPTAIGGAKQQLAAMTTSPNPSPSPLAHISTVLRNDNCKSPNGKHPRRKLFGLSPWHRKPSNESDHSVSSSIRDVLRGETPHSTPEPDRQRLHGEWEKMWPGGEACRIKTPPLRHRSKDGTRPSRAFFMDVSQHSHPSSDSPPSGSHSDTAATNRSEKAHDKEWWEVPLAVPRWEDMGPKSFEFDLPEHLPSSPMCPANKKHKSGGTGVCVYHGRRKRSSAGEAAEKSRNGVKGENGSAAGGLRISRGNAVSNRHQQGHGRGHGHGHDHHAGGRKLEGLLGRMELRESSARGESVQRDRT
ncbi:hypothetical protein BJ170DRAFT_592046 [Xylariales sp. AK1849]|nr:hypothetical protein BJ170DRAFT_592046 [Xylariales sp. AK1849]